MLEGLKNLFGSRALKYSVDPDADLRVAVYGNWDFASTFEKCSPGGSSSWEGVHFGAAEDVRNPDFFLILNAPPRDGIKLRVAPERVWFASGEPPTFEAYNLGQGTGTVVLTCDDRLASAPPADRLYIAEPPFCTSWSVLRSYDELLSAKPEPKTADLSWVTSNKGYLEGHRRRLFFLAWIRERVEFDLFGHGFNPIADKWDGVAPYRYSIAFENHQSPYYFTEKIMDCFVCRTLPIYFGSPDIGRYFPARSFVKLDPDDPEADRRIKEVLASDLYEESKDAVEEARWLVLNKYNMIARLSNLMRTNLAPATRRRRMTLRA